MSNVQTGIIRALADEGIEATPGDEHTGIWVGAQKIGSIGVAVKNWITFHGAAINLNTDLKEFFRINPCGLEPETMISAKKILDRDVSMQDFGQRLIEEYNDIFDTTFEPVVLDDLAEELESQSGSYTV
jgi:lipoate-protein ligase B